MRAKVLTLRFSPQLGKLDDAPLLALQQKVVLDHLREHMVMVGGEPMLLCLAEWREQPQGVVATGPRTNTAACSSRPEPEPQPISPLDPPSPAAEPHPPTPLHAAAKGPARPVGELRAELSDTQRALFDRVRSWRSRTAHEEGAPPYVILTNRQLVELVRQRPDSKAGIARIDGLGDKKVARYGEAILALLWQANYDRGFESAAPGDATPAAAAAAAPMSETASGTPADTLA